jgi:predicted metal-binding membrane protein
VNTLRVAWGREVSRLGVSRFVGFFGVAGLVFAASVAATAVWCLSMSAMGDMPMPGAWGMSAAWAPMCGRTWVRAAASFAGMWVVMMVAMMMPSLVPALWRYREAVAGRAGDMRPGYLTLLVGAGYFFVWAVSGLAAFALGAVLMTLEMRLPAVARAVPVAAGLLVLGAGAFQFTRWKARCLARCHEAPGRGAALSCCMASAWRYGCRLGLRCNYACVGLTATLLVLGVMDLRVMAGVTAGITAERLAPGRERAARIVGVVLVGLAVLLIVRGVAGIRSATH